MLGCETYRELVSREPVSREPDSLLSGKEKEGTPSTLSSMIPNLPSRDHSRNIVNAFIIAASSLAGCPFSLPGNPVVRFSSSSALSALVFSVSGESSVRVVLSSFVSGEVDVVLVVVVVVVVVGGVVVVGDLEVVDG